MRELDASKLKHAAVVLLLAACSDSNDAAGNFEPDFNALDGSEDSSTGDDDVQPSGTDTSSAQDDESPPVEDDSDNGPDDEFSPESYAIEDVFGVPNLDDDDANGQQDWTEYPFLADDDLSVVEVPAAPDGWSVEITTDGDLDGVRLWDGETLALGRSSTESLTSVALTPGPDGTELSAEFGAYLAEATLDVRLLDSSGSEVSRHSVRLLASPLIINHHLQPTERVWVMDVPDSFSGANNREMVNRFAEVLGERFSRISRFTYNNDVWVQDEIEFGTSTGNRGQRLDTVIDSVRNGDLDPLPENELIGPGTISQTWGQSFSASTYDSFGNLEASPPVTVSGVEYPFGRIYYGARGQRAPEAELTTVLAQQRVQAPFAADTTWLCVGHVDEFVSFIPDSTATKGFRMLFADTDAGYEIIDAQPAEASLGRYRSDHGYATAGELQSDAGLRALNRRVQDDNLNPLRVQFIDELGLDAADIILVPSLFEPASNCGGGVVALVPGMVNLVVTNPEGGPVDLFIPDPFFRADGDNQAVDPFIQAFSARMPDELRLQYVDNWDVYHLAWGEVHCGTNVRRTPIEDWWTAALPLVEQPS